MRNTFFRRYLEEVASKTNEALQNGIEPLAIALALRGMADQCDRMALELEKQEAEASKNESEEKYG